MPPLSSTMAEAARLTKAGRLREATDLLRRSLLGQPVPDAPQHPAGRTIDGIYERVGERAGADVAEKVRHRQPPGRFVEESLLTAAGPRPYKLYIPASHAGQILPLIVMLHGCTQGPDDFAVGTRMNELAEREGFLVAYPAQIQAANLQRCWNWFEPGQQQRGGAEPALFAAIIGRLSRDHRVDPARIYAAGLSAGGAAAAILARRYPDLFAAIGVHSGLACGAAHDVPSAFTAMRKGAPGGPDGELAGGVPMIVVHGEADKTVNPRNGGYVIEQAEAAFGTKLVATSRAGKAGGRSYRLAIYADATGRPVLEHWRIEGAGHAWSGGCPAGSFTDPTGPDASAEMVRFFLAHRRG